MGGAKTDDASALLLPQGRLNSIPGRTIHMTLILIGTLAFAISFVYCSFFEWTLHKYIMHNDRFMKYPYQAHQLEHHDIFKADATYFVKDEKDLVECPPSIRAASSDSNGRFSLGGRSGGGHIGARGIGLLLRPL